MKNIIALALAALATAIFVVFWDTSPKLFLAPITAPVADLPTADSYMTSTVTRKFDQRGHQSFLLTAAGSLYFQRDDRLTMTSPRVLVARDPEPSPPWHIDAATGDVFSGGARIVLQGDVHAWRDVDIKGPTAKGAKAGPGNLKRSKPIPATPIPTSGREEIRTSRLSVFPDDKRAETDRPVMLVRPDSKITATGLKANFQRETYQLLSKVKSVYDAP